MVSFTSHVRRSRRSRRSTCTHHFQIDFSLDHLTDSLIATHYHSHTIVHYYSAVIYLRLHTRSYSHYVEEECRCLPDDVVMDHRIYHMLAMPVQYLYSSLWSMI